MLAVINNMCAIIKQRNRSTPSHSMVVPSMPSICSAKTSTYIINYSWLPNVHASLS